MDLRLYVQTLVRHRTLLLFGLCAAVLLAVLSYYRVASDGLRPAFTPRKAEIWQSQANLFLTEGGFPAGRRTIPFVTKVIAGETVAVPRFNEPGRYAGLANLYARLAESDQVRQLIEKNGPLRGQFRATPLADPDGDPLPMVSLFGTADTAARAEATVARGLEGFVAYLGAQQRAARIPANERIELRVVNAPKSAVLLDPRKKTLPVVVFLSVLIAAIASAFVLENARKGRPSIELVEEAEDAIERLPAPTPAPAQALASTPTPAPAQEREPTSERSRARITPEPARAQMPEPEPEPEPEPVVPVRRWA